MNLLIEQKEAEERQDELIDQLYDYTHKPDLIADSITTDNANNVAYFLVHEQTEAARALFRELKYWNDAQGGLLD